jgi:hypothetical protein
MNVKDISPEQVQQLAVLNTLMMKRVEQMVMFL